MLPLQLLVRKISESILKPLPYIEHFKPIPKGSFFKRFYDLREYSKEYPSLIINFANSLRSDLECFLIGPPRRYGLTFSGRIRPLLTHSFNYEKKRNGRPNEIHQVEMWESFLKFFGLNKELDLSPIKTSIERNPNKLGILPGSANNPAKRWPIHKWKKEVELLLNKNKSINIFIYGAFQESELANQISGDFDNSRVINLCGKTSLSELAEELASCAKVVGNDSGGMHLANAVGCPSAVLFGPTNPKVTAPCFNVPLKIIQANKTLKGKTSERLLGKTFSYRSSRGKLMSMMKKMPLPISVAIIAKNEEENLKRLLPNITGFAEEIILVHNDCNDDTVRIAKDHGAQCFDEIWHGYKEQKNLAIQRCTKEWILCMDADEVLSDKLKQSIVSFLTNNSSQLQWCMF